MIEDPIADQNIGTIFPKCFSPRRTLPSSSGLVPDSLKTFEALPFAVARNAAGPRKPGGTAYPFRHLS